jgi:eukaryotic-like serine/threonine-protein kinase
MAEASEQHQLDDLKAKGLATADEVAEARLLLDEAHKTGRKMSVAEAVAAAAARIKTRQADQTPTDDADRAAIEGSDLQLVARIGRGSQAVVYKCRQITMDRMVAVKFLHMSAARDPELRQRFFQEARSAAKLSHPNIVAIHQIKPYKDTFYIVMELVDGGSLGELLALRKRLDVAEAVGIIRAAAEGLACAHKNGIVHRDVKPKNLLLTEGGLVKLADLGLARRTDDSDISLDKPGKAYGTPYYIAPEQITADPNVDARADVYSLGATFFEMVTGRPPFTAATPREVLRKHMTEPPPDPRRFVPSLTPEVCQILMKCLAKRPEDRYASADAFIEAIDNAFFHGHEPAAVDNHRELADQVAELAQQKRLGTDILAAAATGATCPAPRPAPARKLWVPVGIGAAALVAVVAIAALVISNNLRESVDAPIVPAATGTVAGETTPESVKSGAATTSKSRGGSTNVATTTAAPSGTLDPKVLAKRKEAAEFLKIARDLDTRADVRRIDKIRAYKHVSLQYADTPEGKEAQKAVDHLEALGEEVIAKETPKPTETLAANTDTGKSEPAGTDTVAESPIPTPPATTETTAAITPPAKGGAKSSGKTTPKPTPTAAKPPVPAAKPALRINCGGGTVTDSGILWMADQAYGPDPKAGFSWGYTGRGTRTEHHDIRELQAHPVLLDERIGSGLGYQFDVPPGRYTVTLGFVESYFTEKGKRVFGLEVPNAKIRQDVDVFSVAGGRNKPWTRTYTSVPVAAGEKLLIKFYDSKDFPILNAICIEME